ncbi:hypothetical protein [Coleofasciculus sp. E2-BRE-01]|uniref:hypothetical protein n=1 Tax=Coleofasciculus sp. E2-BRE-01 TaxID=3069524 RepID=UPI00330089BC
MIVLLETPIFEPEGKISTTDRRSLKPMNRHKQWKKACFKVTTWVLSEIVLNVLGLDDLADYSEFIFDPEVIVSQYHSVILVAPPHPPEVEQDSLFSQTICDRVELV